MILIPILAVSVPAVAVVAFGATVIVTYLFHLIKHWSMKKQIEIYIGLAHEIKLGDLFLVRSTLYEVVNLSLREKVEITGMTNEGEDVEFLFDLNYLFQYWFMKNKIITGYVIKCVGNDFKIPIDWIYMATVVNNWSEDVWSISSTSFPTKIIKTINHRETIHYFKAPIYRKKRFKK